MKHCRRCDTTKSLSEFGKLSRSKDGYHHKCRTCHNQYMKAFYKANPEETKKRSRKYFEAHRDEQNEKRKARRNANLEKERQTGKAWAASNPAKTRVYKSKHRAKRKNWLTTGVVTNHDLLKLQKQKECFYCKEQTKLTIDHVVPLSKGGKHTLGNLVMACQSCNSSKNNKFLFAWRIYLDRKSSDHS